MISSFIFLTMFPYYIWSLASKITELKIKTKVLFFQLLIQNLCDFLSCDFWYLERMIKDETFINWDNCARSVTDLSN